MCPSGAVPLKPPQTLKAHCKGPLVAQSQRNIHGKDVPLEIGTDLNILP